MKRSENFVEKRVRNVMIVRVKRISHEKVYLCWISETSAKRYIVL